MVKQYSKNNTVSGGIGTNEIVDYGNNTQATDFNSVTPPLTFLRLQIGETSSDVAQIILNSNFSIGELDFDLSDYGTIQEELELLDNVMTSINSKRAEYGTIMNRLDAIKLSNDLKIQNFSASLSTVKDVDMAKTTADLLEEIFCNKLAVPYCTKTQF